MRQVPVYTIEERRPAHGEQLLLLERREFYGSVDVRWAKAEYSWEPDDENCGNSFVYEGQESVPGYHLMVLCGSEFMAPEEEYMLPDELFNEITEAT